METPQWRSSRGEADSASEADQRRLFLSNCFLMILGLMSLAFALVNTFHFEVIPLAAVQLGFFFIVVLALVDMQVNRNIERSTWVTVMSCGGLPVFFYWYVQADYSAAVWTMLFGIINFSLLGTRKGLPVYLAFCAIFLSITVAYRNDWPALASLATLINIFGTMMAFGVAAYFQERSRKVAHDKFETLANLDGLTGISNRRHFLQCFERVRQALCLSGKQYALVLIDIDQFKAVNDTCGHAVGDQVIIAVTRRILSSVRAQDLVARLGGDELCVLLPGCEGSDAFRRAEGLRRVVGVEPVAVGNQSVLVTISAGVANGDPRTKGFRDVRGCG